MMEDAIKVAQNTVLRVAVDLSSHGSHGATLEAARERGFDEGSTLGDAWERMREKPSAAKPKVRGARAVPWTASALVDAMSWRNRGYVTSRLEIEALSKVFGLRVVVIDNADIDYITERLKKEFAATTATATSSTATSSTATSSTASPFLVLARHNRGHGLVLSSVAEAGKLRGVGHSILFKAPP
jgi:hypothetical protein